MRAAAILGLGCSPKNLVPFQRAAPHIEWHVGVPAATDKPDVILLFGGDGTIHRHLHALVQLNLPVLIVPSGSGNDFSRSLGLSHMRNSVSAWRAFCSGSNNIRNIDLGAITAMPATKRTADPPTHGESPKYFATVAGLGLSSEVAARANSMPRWLRGHGGYALTAVPSIATFAPFPMKILAPDDNQNWATRSDAPTIVAAFANSSTFGDGMKIAPRAQLDDGQLDVCLIRSISPFKLFCLFPTVYFGRHLSMREVEYFQAARVRVETEYPLDVYADGEFACQTPVEIGVQAAALKVVSPTQ